MLTDIERFIGPFTANRFEFVYLDKFPFKENKMFFIFYSKDKEEIFTDTKLNEIFPKKLITLYSKYKNINESLSRELYLKPYKLELNKKQKEKGIVTRAFAKQTNTKDDCIFEINPKSSGQELAFYKTVTIVWKLNGSKDEILLRNTEELQKADRIINGISDRLDPLELYEEELTPQQLVEEKLDILYHNPHSYKTPVEASNVSSNVGLSGTHQMPDGTWMPGSSHEAYLKAMGKKRISSKPKVKVTSRPSSY